MIEETPHPSSNAPALSPAEIALVQTRYRLENQLRGGANWFYWIAGLSLINSVINFFEGSLSFLVGLGVTQVVDAIAFIIAEELTGSGVLIVKLIALGFDVTIAAMFVLAGFLAKKRKQWVFIVGMLLYALDAVIFLLVQDWFPFGFHLFALVGMFQGLQALRRIHSLEQQQFPSALEPA
jgi:hypothetical protein